MNFISYAQNREDVMLFRAFKHVERGFYIDVGAHHPDNCSVTKAFYDRGWHGINIEPITEYFQLLQQVRRNDINLNVLALDHEGSAIFYEVLYSGVSTVNTGVSTVNKDYADLHAKKGFKVKSYTFPCTTLDLICSRHKVETIHFLNIDVEGAEKEVLEGFSFSRVRPWIVVIEANAPFSTLDVSGKWESLILCKEYEMTYFDGLNRFYIAKEHSNLKVHFVTPPNIFDEYITVDHWRAKEELSNELSQKDMIAGQLASTKEELANELSQKDMIAGQLASAKEELANELSQKDMIAGQLASAKEELSNELSQKDMIAGQLASVYSSRSWRLTEPLRKVKRVLTKLPNKRFRSVSIKNDTVSIIIPTFNGSRTIEQAINSVLFQTYKDCEIIVVDDGSTDSTVDNIRALYPSLKLIQQSNQGMMSARQRGLELAKGEFIAFLDQDDLWFPEKLEKQVKILKESSAIGAVLSNLMAIDEDCKKLEFNVVPPEKCYTPTWEDLLMLHPAVCPSSSLTRRNVLFKIGGLDCRFGFSGALGDTDMFIRISEITDLHFINEVTGYYRWSEMRPGRLNSFLENLQVYVEKYWNHPRLLKNNGIALRSQFVKACSGYALYINKLLLQQSCGKAPYDLLLKLNNYHKFLEGIFGDQYRANVGLKSLDLNAVDTTTDDLRTLLFLYLSRLDLQNKFIEVINGDLQNFVAWAFEVANGNYIDTDYDILCPFISDFELAIKPKNQSIKHPQVSECTETNGKEHIILDGINQLQSYEDNIVAHIEGLKISLWVKEIIKDHPKTVNKLFPPESLRLRFAILINRGIKVLLNEGILSLLRRSVRYTNNKFRVFLNNGLKKQTLEAAVTIEDQSPDTIIHEQSEIETKIDILISDVGPKLTFPQFDTFLVTIILTVNTNVHNVYGCLENIIAHSSVPYRVILLNNTVAGEIRDFLGKINNIIVFDDIISDEELYVAVYPELSKGKYVLLLRDDTIVTPGFLEQMINIMQSNPKYGATGGRIISPSGFLLEAGGIAWSDNIVSSYGFGDMPDKPEYSYIREVDFCSAHSLLLRKEIFHKICKKDEFQFTKHAEGASVCKMVKAMGYIVMYQPASIVISRAPGGFSLFRTNLLYSNKQVESLQVEYKPQVIDKKGEFDFLIARSAAKTPRILVLDDYIPAIRFGSGFPRLNSMLKCLAELGYAVTFFPVGNPVKVQPDSWELQQHGIEIFWGDCIDFIQFAEERAKYYDIVLISRPHVFQRMLLTVKKYWNKAAIIYDAEAIFYTREILKAEITGKELNEIERNLMIDEELNLIKKADLVISVSHKAKDIMREMTSRNNIVVWEHVQEAYSPAVSFGERHDILFFGSFFAGPGSPNEDAVIYFVNEIFSEIRKVLSCKLYIIGTDPTTAVKNLSAADIEVLGYVKDLKIYFDMCRVNVVPTRFPAVGIPLKLLEAMSYGIPTVTTGLIANHLELADRNEVLVANDSQEFIKRIVELFSNENLWYSIQRNALNYIKKNYSYVTMRNKLNLIFQKGLEIRREKIKPRII